MRKGKVASECWKNQNISVPQPLPLTARETKRADFSIDLFWSLLQNVSILNGAVTSFLGLWQRQSKKGSVGSIKNLVPENGDSCITKASQS